MPPFKIQVMQKLSIIIGSFRAHNFIEECLSSIQNQTAFNNNLIDYEILLGIDGCMQTLKAVTEIEHLFPKLQAFYFPINKGVYTVKNSLLPIASGDGVLFFDADDKMNPDMIEKCLSYGAPLIIGEDGVTFWNKSDFDITGGFMPWYCAADTEHLNRYERACGCKIKRCKRLFYYRKHADQLTADINTNRNSALRAKYISIINDNVIPDKISPPLNPFKPILEMKIDKIHCGIASFPAREKSLRNVVASIIHQVDHLYVYLNEYSFIPEYLNNPKITVYRSHDHIGDLGDVGKFFYQEVEKNIEGYFLTIDDDLIYAPKYVELLISNIEKYQRKNIVTCHGRKFLKYPLTTMYHDPFVGANCTKGNNNDIVVDFGGTGVMGYHSDTIRFSMQDFTYINMTDVFVGIIAQRKGVPIVCPTFPKGLISVDKASDVWLSIWASCHQDDSIQTNLINDNYVY